MVRRLTHRARHASMERSRRRRVADFPRLMIAAAFVLTPIQAPAQSASANAGVGVANDTTLARLINGLVDSVMRDAHIPGAAVAVVRDGRVVFKQGYGLANVDERRPVDVDRTMFRIGSTTKLITALAVMQLVDTGRLGLDDPVSRWVDAPRIETRFRQPVRVSHVIDHTGGFDQIGDERRRLVWSPGDRQTLSDFLEGQLRTTRPPGQAATYDTYGISLAGLVVERAARQPYAVYLRQRVFLPLGMTRSFVETPDSLRNDLAVGYGWVNGSYVRQRYEYYASTPASSVDATVADMARLMIALLGDGSANGGRLFSKAMAERVRAPQHPSRRVRSFSYGFWEDEANGQRLILHGGSMLGFEGLLLLVPDHGVGLYVAYNRDPEAGGGPARLAPALRDRLLNHWFPPPRSPALPEPLPIDTRRFEGAYSNGVYCHGCFEGEGWPFGFITLRAAGPGIIDAGGARWRAVDSLLFVSERNPSRRIEFTEVGGQVAYLSQVGFGTMRERLDSRFLDETLGHGWRARPAHPLAARVYYANEQWDECTVVYLDIIARRPQDGDAAFFGGRCARGAGRFDDALRLLQRAWESNHYRHFTAYHLGAVYARRGDVDSALTWLRRAVELRHPRLQMLDTDPDLESVRRDPRFAQLRQGR